MWSIHNLFFVSQFTLINGQPSTAPYPSLFPRPGTFVRHLFFLLVSERPFTMLSPFPVKKINQLLPQPKIASNVPNESIPSQPYRTPHNQYYRTSFSIPYWHYTPPPTVPIQTLTNQYRLPYLILNSILSFPIPYPTHLPYLILDTVLALGAAEEALPHLGDEHRRARHHARDRDQLINVCKRGEGYGRWQCRSRTERVW